MRSRISAIGLLLVLAILACSLGAPSTPSVSLTPRQPETAVTVPPATDSPAATSPVTTSPATTAPQATVSTSAPPLPIDPQTAPQITLLASLQSAAVSRINHITWQPNGQALLVESSKGLSLIDPQSWQTLWSIPRSFAQLAFSPDGAQLFALDGAGLAVRLDAATGTELSSSPLSPQGRYAISPTGKFIAETLGGEITLRDWQTGEVLKSLPADINSGAIVDMAFSVDEKWAIAGSDNGDLQAWNVETGQLSLFRPARIPSPVYQCEVRGAMAGAPTGSLLVFCSYPAQDNQSVYTNVGVFSASANVTGSGLEIKDAEGKGYADFTANADHSRVATAAGNSVEVWSTSGNRRTRTLTGTAGDRMAFNPADKNLLAVWSERAIQIWNVNDGEKINEWGTTAPAPDPAPVYLAFPPLRPGRLLAVGRQDGAIQLWDVATGQKTASWQDGQFQSLSGLAYSPDGSLLAASSQSGQVVIFGAAQLKPQLEFKTGFPVSGIAFSPGGRLLYIIGDSVSVTVWSVADGKKTAEWKAGAEYLRVLAARGDTLAVGSSYGVISSWKKPGGQSPDTFRFANLQGTPVLQISPDETQLILLKGFTLQVWEIASQRIIRSWQVEHTPGLAFSPDGCLLLVGDGFWLNIMDVMTGSYIKTITESMNLTSSPAFSPDGALLAVGYANSEVRIWGLPGALEAPNGPVPALRCGSFPPQ